jgi:hypothetical protein
MRRDTCTMDEEELAVQFTFTEERSCLPLDGYVVIFTRGSGRGSHGFVIVINIHPRQSCGYLIRMVGGTVT